MDEEWRHTAKSVTKYNPFFRDGEGYYKKEEWIGFFQLGKIINGELFTFDIYEEIERKYIAAAKLFFQYHNCNNITIKNLEKYSFSSYRQSDKNQLVKINESINEGSSFQIDNIDMVIKLILRELIWAELFCDQGQTVAVRFGYDFYMYFNSEKDMDELIGKVNELGLFVS